MAVYLQSLGNNIIKVVGDLTFTTVVEVTQQLRSLLCNKKQLSIDLSQVRRCDSAGVAALLDWMKDAKRAEIKLSFNNFTKQVQQIIHICGLDKILRDES